MSPLAQSLIVFAVLMGGAATGFTASLFLPESHVSDGTRTHFAATVSVVATLAALVIGLSISTASTARSNMIQDLALLSSNIIRVDTHLRDFGPAADKPRADLAAFGRHCLADLFPDAPGAEADPGNRATTGLLDQAQVGILALAPRDAGQRWQQAQALQLSAEMETVRWAMAEQGYFRTPAAVLTVISFWLAVLFATYGLFMPRHATAIVALVLSAAAVALAIFLIIEARTPFSGLVHIPSTPLREAVAAVEK